MAELVVFLSNLRQQLFGPTPSTNAPRSTPTQVVASALMDADIPVVIYAGDPAAAEADVDDDMTDTGTCRKQPEECTVCLEEIVVGQEVRVMPRCGHMFHRRCIDEWLRCGPSGTCPICRNKVIAYVPKDELPTRSSHGEVRGQFAEHLAIIWL